jgi:hypothetical protein
LTSSLTLCSKLDLVKVVVGSCTVLAGAFTGDSLVTIDLLAVADAVTFEFKICKNLVSAGARKLGSAVQCGVV